MSLTHPNLLLKSIFPSLVWQIPTAKDDLFLSFDDGPTPGVTDILLDLLQTHSAKATFFCIGNNIKNNPKLFSRIIQEGHKIGNHTYSHLNGWKSRTIDYFQDISQFEEYHKTDLFRPPYGRIKPSQIKNLKRSYKIIMWSTLSMDYHSRYKKEDCLSICTKNVKSGDVFVFHDSQKAKDKMLYCVEEMLKKYSGKYSFKPIDLVEK